MEKIELEIANIQCIKESLKKSYDNINNKVIKTFDILLPKMKCQEVIDWDYFNPDYDIPRNYNLILGRLPRNNKSFLLKKGIFREDLFTKSIHLNIYTVINTEISGIIENFKYQDVTYAFMPIFLKDYKINQINNEYCIGFPLDFLFIEKKEILNIIQHK